MKPNEVLYVVIAVIVGYVVLSEMFRCIRAFLYRQRTPPAPAPTLETGMFRRRRTHHHHHHHHHRRRGGTDDNATRTHRNLRSFKADKTMADTICCICLEPFRDSDVTAGGCSHTLHTRCILKWLKKDKAQSCPVCRKPFIEEDDEDSSTALPPPPPTPVESVPSSPPPESVPPPTPSQSVPPSPPSSTTTPPPPPPSSVSSSVTGQSLILQAPPLSASPQFVPSQNQEQVVVTRLETAIVSG